MSKLSYDEACQEAAKQQGVDVILAKLTEAGVNAYLWQSGGFTMVVRADLPDGRIVMANEEGASVYGNEEDAMYGEGRHVHTTDVEGIVRFFAEAVKG